MGHPEKLLERAPTGELYLGSLIRELRWQKGLSRAEAAVLLEYHPDSLSKIETNKANPSEQKLPKIAKLLDVPLEDLEQAPVHPRTTQTANPPDRLQSLTLPSGSKGSVLLLLDAAPLEQKLNAVLEKTDALKAQLQKLEDRLEGTEADLKELKHSYASHSSHVVLYVDESKVTYGWSSQEHYGDIYGANYRDIYDFG